MYQSYPSATWVNVVRNATAWYQSLKSFSDGSLFVRFRLCNATGSPNGQATRDDFIRFYQHHQAQVRRFVHARPSLSYIEVPLEDPQTGLLLEQATGIPASCWQHCPPLQKGCSKVIQPAS
jgi:hypothetical protein